MATSVFTPGKNRVAFGMIDDQSGFVYGKTALYVAPTPDAKARGPFPAPADVLITQGRYRSKQAATEADPFAAVYAAQVPFKKPGDYSILAVTKDGSKTYAAPGQVKVISKADERKKGSKALGPFPAPADVLLTQGRYRSKQAATEADPFAAVYAAQVPFKKPGDYSILAVTKDGDEDLRRARPGQGRLEGGRPHPRRRRDGAEGGDRHQGVGARRHLLDRHAHAAVGHARAARSPTWSASSRSRCCSRRRSCASRASAGRWSTSRCS